MIKAHIEKGSNTVSVTARGGVPELMNDMALLVSGVHAQLQAADPMVAAMFRTGVINMAMDLNGPFWNTRQTGIIIQTPEKND